MRCSKVHGHFSDDPTGHRSAGTPVMACPFHPPLAGLGSGSGGIAVKRGTIVTFNALTLPIASGLWAAKANAGKALRMGSACRRRRTGDLR
jgi:hypothetical protein